MRDIDMNPGDRQKLAHARQDVTTILRGLARALPNGPNTCGTHRIWREHDESYLRGQRPKAENGQGALASGSVKEHQER
jgi:hypothetical protein